MNKREVKLKLWIELWNKISPKERIKVIRTLGSIVSKMANDETLCEPSEEYGAYDTAYHLLFALLSEEEYLKQEN